MSRIRSNKSRRGQILTGLVLAIGLVSCSSGKDSNMTAEQKLALEVLQGKALVEKSDCMSCHNPEAKLVGPSFRDLAEKYEANAENYATLTKKVIAGGRGTWGPVGMSPHPDLSEADVKKMLTYILSHR